MPNITSGCCGFGKEVLPIRYEWHKSSNVNANVYTKVFDSEIVNNTRDPRWNVQKKNISVLCNAEDHISFRIIFFSGAMRLGFVQSTLGECKNNAPLRF